MIQASSPTSSGPTPAQRRLAVVTVVLLLLAGLVGVDLWPLTAWRLFSQARDDSQTHWILESADTTGAPSPISLEDLPMRYQLAEWPMASASAKARGALCVALLAAVQIERPATVELRILRDRQKLVNRRGEWVVSHDKELVRTCKKEPEKDAGDQVS